MTVSATAYEMLVQRTMTYAFRDSDPDKTQPNPNSFTLETPQLPDDQSKKPRSKNPVSRYSPPFITGKRPAESSDSQRIKKKPDVDIDGEKKQLFQRLWSEENEIELVKARRLKKKFENNVAKVENKGKVRSFSNPHEKKMYDLSKNLWGTDANQNVVLSSTINKVKVKVNVTPVGASNGNEGIEVIPNEVDLKVMQPPGSLGSMGLPITKEVIVNKGLELVLGAKKVEMEKKWKYIKTQELKLFLKKVDILKGQAEAVLKAIVNSGGK
ncbi:hypothetical protein QVD17_21351 [Tagetes erecta]|uniref:Glabrous enhancer-binding protein-like DBD domain-containing protein n=1 Tax=Tagetes erecta TaxID=13708 RepID=A0AAD8KBX0_TARER|nr:hypothetical protein QVD17_21351 [Tagetes erecta]